MSPRGEQPVTRPAGKDPGRSPVAAPRAPRHRTDDRRAAPAQPDLGWTPAPAALQAPRRGGAGFGWIAPVRIWQLATWEVAVLAVAFTFDRATPVKAAVAALAVVAVGLTSVRIGGCCWAQWAGTLVSYWRRRQSASQHRGSDPLTALVPDLRLREHVDRAGNRVGVAVFAEGLTTVVRLAPAERPDLGTLLAVLRETFASTAIQLAAAQLVVWTVAAPPQHGHAVKAPVRVYWLAVRYQPDQSPRAALARGGGETGAIRAAASAALSLAVRLDDAGYASAVLDRATLAQELTVALGATADPVLATAASARETWRTWSAAGVQQACYLPDRRVDPANLLERWLPWAAFSCVSYTLRPAARGHIQGEVVVRLGGAATVNRARTPAPGSVFGRTAVRTTGRNHRYVLRTLPLAVSR